MDMRNRLREEDKRYSGNGLGVAHIGIATSVLKKTLEESGVFEETGPKIGDAFWKELIPDVRSQWKEQKSNPNVFRYVHHVMRSDRLIRQKVNPKYRETLAPVISSFGKVDDLVSHEYGSGDLVLEPLRFVMTERNNSAWMLYHFWMFKGDFTLQVNGCDEFYPAEVIEDLVKEVGRWVSGIASETP